MKGRKVGMLSAGDCFGEAVLYANNVKRSATITTRTFCQLFLLSKSAVTLACSAYPAAYQQLKVRAREAYQRHLAAHEARARAGSNDSIVQGNAVSVESLTRKSAASNSGMGSSLCDAFSTLPAVVVGSHANHEHGLMSTPERFTDDFATLLSRLWTSPVCQCTLSSVCRVEDRLHALSTDIAEIKLMLKSLPGLSEWSIGQHQRSLQHMMASGNASRAADRAEVPMVSRSYQRVRHDVIFSAPRRNLQGEQYTQAVHVCCA